MQNDLISRSALKRHIIAFAAGCHTTYLTIGNIAMMINQVDNADAIEIGNCDGCRWKEIGRRQKCSCCRRNRYLKDCYERRADDCE